MGLRIIFNSFAQLFARIISTGSVLLATILITQNLSREIWGDFVIVISYITLFSLFIDFGLNGILVRKLTQSEEETENYFKNLLGLRLVLSLITIFVALSVLAFIPHSNSVKFGIIVGSFLLLTGGIFNTSAVIFQQKLRYDFFAVSDIVGSLTTLFLVYLAVRFNSSLFIIVAIFVIGAVVKAVLSVLLAEYLVKVKGIAFNFVLWKSFLLGSLPIGLMLIFSQFNANIDKQILALSSFTGLSASLAVAFYGLAYRMFDFAIALPTFIVNASYPVLLDKFKESNLKLREFSQKLMVGLLILGGLVAIFGWLLAPTAVGIFGNYSEAVLPLRILLLGTPLFFATSLLVWLTVTLEKEFWLPFIYGFAALSNVVLNLNFIPKYGYNAAAWISVLCEAMIFVLLTLLVVTRLKTEQNTINVK